ncbi:hypothetical protein M758_11G127700 [Ceratodon purpureus]|nr:hypothetical protein M758_11G127700 [Ceratodon purpureus]
MGSPTFQKTKPVSSVDRLQVYRVWGATIAVITVVVFSSIFITSDLSPLGIINGTSPQEQIDLIAKQQVSESIAPRNDAVVQAFVAELQQATAHATGKDSEGNWFQQSQWNRDYSCLSRTELPQKYSRRNYVRDSAPNPQWRAVLREYAKLHRTCMRKVGNVTAYFMSRNTSIDCQFTVVDTDEIGIGNRFLVIASAVLYSILTKRVVLLAGNEDFIPEGLLCEPFEGSSWRGFDVNRIVTPYRGGENPFWNNSGSFHSRIDEAVKDEKPFDDYAVANIDAQSWVGQPQSRFYCDVEQENYKNVTFMYLTGMLYFLPKLFTVPSFRPVLEALFPDRMALTSILREVMLPADEVWTRVQRMEQTYLEGRVDRRLGVQLRYRGGWGEYNGKFRTIAGRVLQCALDNNILPLMVNNTERGNDEPALAMRMITVFVASLYEGVKNNLTETFLRHPTATGDAVKVVQLSSEGDQKFGKLVYQSALAEVLTLSFSDHLFVTPKSTFSGLAQAYGGVVPWFIDWRDNVTESGPCTRAQTVDVCFQAPFDYNIKCPYDHERHDKNISEVYPDVQPCLAVDTGGLQLITKNDMSMELLG